MISLIVAHDKNRVIGLHNEMPWHLPEELKYFKKMTMGKPIIMGRKTFESIGRPLPGRRNIVITRNPDYQVEGVEVVNNLENALELVKDAEEVMVIGGEQIFKLALPIANRLYITFINHEFEGDTFFPQYDLKEWKLVRESETQATKEGYTYTYKVFEKQ